MVRGSRVIDMKPIEINFDDRKNIPDEIWWAFCDSDCPIPVPFEGADLSNQYGWVYCRRWGIFYAQLGQHAFISAQILAWELGYNDFRSIPDDLIDEINPNTRSFDVTCAQDYLLENYPGIALLSSSSKKVHVFNEENFL